MKVTVSISALDHTLLRLGTIALLFLYIYAPQLLFLPINFNYFIILLAMVYFSSGNNLSKLTELLRIKPLFTFLYFYFFCIVYTVVVLLFSEQSGNTFFFITYIRLLIDIVLIIPFFIIIYSDELGFTMDDFMNELVIIGTIQGIIAFFMVILPGLKEFVFTYLVELPSEKLTDRSYRGFGISYDFFFSMPLFQALVFAVNTKLFIEKGKSYLLCYPFILISIIVNARIAIVMIPVLFGIIVLMSFYYNNLQWMKKLWWLVVMMLMLVAGIFIYLITNPEQLKTLIWLTEGILGAIQSLFGTGESRTLNAILLKHFHFPQQTFEILFGKGLIVFDNPKSPVMSDLGYIRYIYYGGILLSAIFYFSIINFTAHCISLAKDKFLKILLIAIIAMVFIAHFKGDVFSSSALMKGFFMVQIFLLYDRKKNIATR